MTVPGLPLAGTTEASAFWASFWSSLYSGLISSIVTGLVVGLMILLMERGIEARISRNLTDRELSVLREQVREAIEVPGRINISSALASVSPKAASVYDVIRDKPITDWLDQTRKHKTLLRRVIELKKAYSAFRVAALQYDDCLVQQVRNFNAARGAIASNDDRFRTYILASQLGFDWSEIRPWVDLGQNDETPHPRYEEVRLLAESDEKFTAAQEQFVTCRQDLEDKVQELATELHV